MTFERKMVGNILVLTPNKNLVGGPETTDLLKAIEEVAAVGPATVVVDLGELKWVSSMGVGLLRKASMTCEKSGGWLRLARVGQIVESTLLVTGLIIYFETFETVDLAVASPVNAARAFPRGAEKKPQRPEA